MLVVLPNTPELIAAGLIAALKAQAAQLRKWAVESESGGWSTHQTDPMRREADNIDRVVFFAERNLERAKAAPAPALAATGPEVSA